MPKRIENPDDIVGTQFGKLTVVSYFGREKQGRQTVPMYICTCLCGTTNVKVSRWSLKRGYTTSCGCAHKDAGKRHTEDLTGKRFGRWTVLRQANTRYIGFFRLLFCSANWNLSRWIRLFKEIQVILCS